MVRKRGSFMQRRRSWAKGVVPGCQQEGDGVWLGCEHGLHGLCTFELAVTVLLAAVVCAGGKAANSAVGRAVLGHCGSFLSAAGQGRLTSTTNSGLRQARCARWGIGGNAVAAGRRAAEDKLDVARGGVNGGVVVRVATRAIKMKVARSHAHYNGCITTATAAGFRARARASRRRAVARCASPAAARAVSNGAARVGRRLAPVGGARQHAPRLQRAPREIRRRANICAHVRARQAAAAGAAPRRGGKQPPACRGGARSAARAHSPPRRYAHTARRDARAPKQAARDPLIKSGAAWRSGARRCDQVAPSSRAPVARRIPLPFAAASSSLSLPLSLSLSLCLSLARSHHPSRNHDDRRDEETSAAAAAAAAAAAGGARPRAPDAPVGRRAVAAAVRRGRERAALHAAAGGGRAHHRHGGEHAGLARAHVALAGGDAGVRLAVQHQPDAQLRPPARHRALPARRHHAHGFWRDAALRGAPRARRVRAGVLRRARRAHAGVGRLWRRAGPALRRGGADGAPGLRGARAARRQAAGRGHARAGARRREGRAAGARRELWRRRAQPRRGARRRRRVHRAGGVPRARAGRRGVRDVCARARQARGGGGGGGGGGGETARRRRQLGAPLTLLCMFGAAAPIPAPPAARARARALCACFDVGRFFLCVLKYAASALYCATRVRLASRRAARGEAARVGGTLAPRARREAGFAGAPRPVRPRVVCSVARVPAQSARARTCARAREHARASRRARTSAALSHAMTERTFLAPAKLASRHASRHAQPPNHMCDIVVRVQQHDLCPFICAWLAVTPRCQQRPCRTAANSRGTNASEPNNARAHTAGSSASAPERNPNRAAADGLPNLSKAENGRDALRTRHSRACPLRASRRLK
ncbi:RemN protein [Gracilaria domingensis]|nr:RemN protein [Gracilaria domingensis]